MQMALNSDMLHYQPELRQNVRTESKRTMKRFQTEMQEVDRSSLQTANDRKVSQLAILAI